MLKEGQSMPVEEIPILHQFIGGNCIFKTNLQVKTPNNQNKQDIANHGP